MLCLLGWSSILSFPSGGGALPTAHWPGRVKQERLETWEIRVFIQTVGPSPFQGIWIRSSIFSWNAGTGELPDIRDKEWLVTPIMPRFLCLSHNGLIGNEAFQGKLFRWAWCGKYVLKFSSDLRNSPKPSQVFWPNKPTPCHVFHILWTLEDRADRSGYATGRAAPILVMSWEAFIILSQFHRHWIWGSSVLGLLSWRWSF